MYAYDPLFGDDVRWFGAELRSLDNVNNIDAVVIATDYREFKKIGLGELKLRHRVLEDGRGVVENTHIEKHEWVFYSIGNCV